MTVPGGSVENPAANPRDFGSCRIRPALKIDTYPGHSIRQRQRKSYPRLFTRAWLLLFTIWHRDFHSASLVSLGHAMELASPSC